MITDLATLVQTLQQDNLPGETLDEQIKNLRRMIPADIKIRWELHEGTLHRVLLTTDKKNTHYDTMLSWQANGVVLDATTWKPLAVPAECLNFKYRCFDVVKNFSKYELYAIDDGTTVVLYWDSDGSWKLASANAINIAPMYYMGPLTYMEVFTEIITKYGITLDDFDKDLSYVIGFRHHNFHPLTADLQRAWLIAAHRGFEPAQTTIGIPLQKKLRTDVITNPREWLKTTAKGRLAEYLASARDSAASVKLNYGYILRWADDNTDAPNYRNILIESDLLRTIRNFMYMDSSLRGKPVPYKHKAQFNGLRAWLNPYHRYTFVGLYPQYSVDFMQYNADVTKLAQLITGALRTKSGHDILDPNNKLEGLALALKPMIEKMSRINPFDTTAVDIVFDFIASVKFLDTYAEYYGLAPEVMAGGQQ